MKATATVENIIPLVVRPKAAKPLAHRHRFKIQPFINPRTQSQSWRVTGMKRDGSRVRENFTDQQSAECRQVELMNDWLAVQTDTVTRPTKLTDDQLRLSEAAMIQLGDDWERIIDAVTYWKQHGKQRTSVESPRIDDATERYLVWLKASPFRDATKRHWRIRMNKFRNSVQNLRVADVTAEVIQEFLSKRNLSESGKDTDRRAVSRFFSWCIERKWAVVNPCHNLPRSERGESAPIKVLTVAECISLLKAAQAAGLAPYVAVCLFGGMRPTIASELRIGVSTHRRIM